jgi:ectoine hydroxylase-related dioxygenase (phytanoyl-CoA dioxygenase family)
LVEPILGPGCFAVRVLWFDKTPDANWKVPWHQDLAIAVQARAEVDGFGGWSEKAGVTHVQPPTWLLERMVTVRLHLDDCGPNRGPLRVLPGSHHEGRLQPAQIQQWQQEQRATECVVNAGDAILMRPLLLHASSEATTPGHRRVLHIEFANTDLPGGLQWHACHER